MLQRRGKAPPSQIMHVIFLRCSAWRGRSKETQSIFSNTCLQLPEWKAVKLNPHFHNWIGRFHKTLLFPQQFCMMDLAVLSRYSPTSIHITLSSLTLALGTEQPKLSKGSFISLNLRAFDQGRKCMNL